MWNTPSFYYAVYRVFNQVKTGAYHKIEWPEKHKQKSEHSVISLKVWTLEKVTHGKSVWISRSDNIFLIINNVRKSIHSWSVHGLMFYHFLLTSFFNGSNKKDPFKSQKVLLILQAQWKFVREKLPCEILV